MSLRRTVIEKEIRKRRLGGVYGGLHGSLAAKGSDGNVAGTVINLQVGEEVGCVSELSLTLPLL